MAEVTRIFPEFAPASDCSNCGEAHRECGVLCKACRGKQARVAESFVQSSIASAIGELRRYQNQGGLLSGPVGAAYDKMRRAYDAAEPLVEISGRGYVECIEGELWAYPEDGVSVGPFGNEDEAQQALTNYHTLKPVVT